MSDKRYNKLYVKMMDQVSRSKSRNESVIIPEMGNSGMRTNKLSKSPNRNSFKEIIKSIKEKGESKRKIVKKLLNKSLKVRSK